MFTEKNVTINGSFWGKKQMQFTRNVVLSQWRMLNGETLDENGNKFSGCVDNFRIVAGEMQGEHRGHWFVDHDLYKWMEGAAYSLMVEDCQEVRNIFEYIISLFQKVQGEDGYMNTYFTTHEEPRWSNFGVGHELLCVGNLTEAAIVYAQATGDERLIEIAKKAVDNVIDVVNKSERHVYPGHEEIEIALLRLYRHTGEEKYVKLCEYFLNERGTGECAFKGESLYESLHLPDDYYQIHKPVREQDEAFGHAVRAVYLYTAMAELAQVDGDTTLLTAARKLWENIVTKKMYVTGGIGSEHQQERFTQNYDLPSDRSYSETCASIGFMMLSRALLKAAPDARVADVMNGVLYNALLSGFSPDGLKYFYVNTLSQKPKTNTYRHDSFMCAPERMRWMDCPCCPPNALRFINSLGEYIYSVTKDGIYLNLFVSNETDKATEWGNTHIRADFTEPNCNELRLQFSDCPNLFVLKPSWADEYSVTVDGNSIYAILQNGYISLPQEYADKEILIQFYARPHYLYGNENIEDTAGKVSVRFGYFIYCVEEADNGDLLANFLVDADKPIVPPLKIDANEGFRFIKIAGYRMRNEDKSLYTRNRYTLEKTDITLVPYYYHSNRGVGEMVVWLKTLNK